MDNERILRFSLVIVAMFAFLSSIATAGDTSVEAGDIFTEKSNELFLSLKNTEAGGHDYRLVSAGSLGGIGTGKFGIYDATAGKARLIIDSDGEVGIGTASPATELDVNGVINMPLASGGLRFDNRVDDAITWKDYTMSVRASNAFVFNMDSNGNEGDYFDIQDTGTSRFYITGEGNIGIGTKDPQAPGLEIFRDNADSGIRFHDINDWSWAIGMDYSDGRKFKISGNAAYPGESAATDRFVIDSSGNVGIGTTIPATGYKLDVAGNARIRGFTFEHQGADFQLGTSDGRPIGARNLQRALVHGAPLTPADLLTVNYDGDFEGGTLIAGNTNTPNLFVSAAANGNVGIGTTNPAVGNKLDVSGKIHATQDVCTDLAGGKCLSTVSGAISETDPQVDTLTSSKWCIANSGGTAIDCSQNAPLLSETDPEVGTITNGKWCKATAGVVKCDQDTPSGDSDWVISGTDMYSGVTGKVGIGATIPKTKLDVAGEIKFGNTGLTCNSDAAGAIRYNSGSKVMEFCDGSSWKQFSGGTTPTPPPAAKTKVQCSVDGSATDTSTTACSQVTSSEVSHNTFDSCSGDASTPGESQYMWVNDVKLEGSIAAGGSVTPSVEVKCYSSNTKWAIYFHDGTSWVEKCKGSCTGSGLEWKSCSAFNLPSSSGTYYLRGIENWNSGITAACVTTTYGDHDDIKIQI